MSTPAFPISALVYNEQGKDPTTIINDGMTLRDYFAAKAIDECLKSCVGFESAAEEAYMMADAMMKARQV